MSRSHGSRFSGADSSWWHMEDPANQMTITAVLAFDGPLDPVALRSALRHRLVVHDRFRRCVREGGLGLGRPHWVDDGAFDLEHHLDRATLPAPADRAALQALVGEEMSRTLDYRRPLWRVVYVDNYRGGSALVVRVHHCIADGLALVRLLLTLDDEDGKEDAAYGRFRESRVGNGLALGAKAAGSLGRLVGMRPDPLSTLRGDLGPTKRAAWSDPLRISDLRDVAAGIGVTLNDLVLAAIAGSLGRFLDASGDRLRRHIRAVVPVSLRRCDERETLGNRFGLVFAPLPVMVTDPLARLAAVHRAMDRLKRSPEAGVVYGLLEVFGRTHRRALDLAVAFLGSKASLVLTNVPGPRARVRLCGRELVEAIAWVPQSGRLRLGLSVMSYADDLRFGVTADAGLVPDPGILVDAYQEAAEQLCRTGRPAAPPRPRPAATGPSRPPRASRTPAAPRRKETTV